MSVETPMEVPETSGTIMDPEIKGHAEKEIYAEKPTSSESISTTSSRIPNVDDEELLTGATTATIGLDDDDKDNPRPIVPVAAAVVQQWYQSLTAEERSGAVTFCDGAFLSAFLALATPWSLHQPQPEARRRRDVEGNGAYYWDSLVSISDFEAKYEDFIASQRNTPLLANRKSAMVVQQTAHDGSQHQQHTVNERETSSFGPNDDNGGDDSVSTSLRIPMELDSKNTLIDGNSEKERRQPERILEHVSIIFPSAFKHISASVESHPHVTIRPLYFDTTLNNNINVGEHFLDTFLEYHPDQQWSSSSDCGSINNARRDSLLWLRRMHEVKDSTTDNLVPLSTFLLARFEWAVWESYMEFECDKNKTGRAPSATAKIMDAKGDNARRHLLSSLGDVLSHCGAMNDVSMTIDSLTLSSFVAPFLDACLPKKHPFAIATVDQVENVILTPLKWIMCGNRPGKPVNLVLLDSAVETSLERMENHAPKTELMQETVTMTLSRTSDPLIVASGNTQTVNSTPNGHSSPRKKKKKHKKKKKKKSNATDHLFEALGAAHSSISSVEDDVDIVEAGIEFNTGNVDSNKSLEDNCDKLSPGKMEEDVEPKSPDEPDDESVDSDGSSVDSQEAPQAVKNLENNGLTKNTLEVESVEHLVFNKQTLISERNGVDDITVVAPENVGSNIDGENWETVEVRGRGSRKKPAERFNNVSVRHFNNISSVALPYDATKKPKVSRTVIPRKKVVAKRIIRDILNAIIDSIEEESRKKKQHFSSPPRTANSWKNGPPGSRLLGQPAKRDFASVVSTSAAPISDISLRTVVTGNRTPAQDKKHLSQEEISKKSGGQIVAGVDAIRTSPESKQSKAHPRTSADQSTAPTFQETISTSSNVKTGSKQELLNAAEDRKSESSSAEDTEEVPTINVQRTATKTEETLTNTPPLPTLLSPENANSATSSVASSLEAPHAGRLHHHSATSANVNDVGYHLLDVCDRLSRDMSLFMSRRALALSARRRERCAIMSALQDSVSLLWPRRCHVELYGSCATQLDLPSSDIDVVVLGLDRLDSSCPVVNSSKSASSDSMGTSLSMDEFSLTDDTQQVVLPHFQTATFGMLPVHRNADRVLRLAAELEGQPWAVQVNAIPTASVPVVKVLADPSKLTCNGGEWMAQHQHMVAQVAAAAGKCQPLGNKSSQEFTASEHGSFHPTLLPWRGSDVMKGLLSLDITFEGPEHGGVGSTEFSSRIVMDACAESGLHPDATPFVQVLMVLKELLSQRKLNEPYSGGLSSYALLLLVLALVHERAVIRDEIERVEQQKRAMTSGDQSTFVPAPNAFLTASVNAAPFFHPSYPVGGNPMTMATVVTVDTPATANSKPVTAYSKQESKSSNGFKKDIGVSTKLSQKKALQTSGPKNRPQSVKDKNTEPVRSSQDIGKPLSLTWASIAKNSSVQLIHKNPPREKPTIQADHDENTKTERKPSFADAVMRSTKRIEASVLKSASSVEKVVSQDGDLENEYSPADKCITEETGRLVQKSACQVSTKKFPSIANIEPLPIAPVVSPLGDSTPRVTPPFHPQGYNDIIEVLCSGETTAGKLLMHFLLFYGQHFDAQSTAVDVSGKHERDFTGHMAPFSYQSPYIQRRAHGNIDPITGMLTVDPIVIYDPLEGAENNNVARRCFAWNSVRWIFAQSYATLASAVERSATPPSTPGSCSVPVSSSRESRGRDARVGTFNPEAVGDLLDPSSPILKCLLSF